MLEFRGERSVFSNFYTKPFIVDGYRYLSVEQFFQYSKAVYFKDSNLARKIIMTSDPKQIQILGDRVEVPADEWDEWISYCQEEKTCSPLVNVNCLRQPWTATLGAGLG